ncbi:MAG: DUF1840 domain-containing protein [Gallionella sp.]|nr:DUF1840 domain-containing protein [Gallionella sp.]
MLVTFKTDAHANIIMFGNDALSMLKIMGHSGTIPSAILARDVPEALGRLSAAIDQARRAGQDADTDESDVSLVKRGLPLLDLFTAAARAKNDVMWD